MKSRVGLAWPYLFGLTALVALPALGAIVLAFTDFSGIQPPSFTGLDNFRRLVSDAGFWTALGNSAVYVAISVPLRLLGAVGVALLLHRAGRGVRAARVIAYLPTIVPDAAFALLWLWVLNPFYGPLSVGLRSLGLDPPHFLTEPWTTRVTIAVIGAFQVGEGFIVALAARRSIPPQLYEAAAVDGARPWFTLRTVTLPLMLPILALLALRDIILSFQVNFVPALLITNGGPRYATTYLSLYLYKNGFQYFRLGYAATIAVVMFLITAGVVLVQYRLARKWRIV